MMISFDRIRLSLKALGIHFLEGMQVVTGPGAAFGAAQ